MSRTLDAPRQPEILDAHSDRREAAVKKCMPGEIVSYDKDTQTATVRLVLTDQGQVVPDLQDVPILMLGGSDGFISVPLTSGDGVMVLCFDQDPGVWLAQGGRQDPFLTRRHGYYPVAIPGVRRSSEAFAQGDGQVVVHGEVRLGSADADRRLATQESLSQLYDALIVLLGAISAGGGPLLQPTVAAAKLVFEASLTTWQDTTTTDNVRAD